MELHDTLWTGVDHRRARFMLAARLGTLEAAHSKLAEERNLQVARNKLLTGSLGAALEDADKARKDMTFWERKAKGRGRRGFVLGLLTALGGFIAVDQLGR